MHVRTLGPSGARGHIYIYIYIYIQVNPLTGVEIKIDLVCVLAMMDVILVPTAPPLTNTNKNCI